MTTELSVEKKVCAIAFSRNGAYVLAADKYGSVLVAPTAPIIRGEKVSFVPLLGHFCTIVTALSFSRDGRFLCSGLYVHECCREQELTSRCPVHLQERTVTWRRTPACRSPLHVLPDWFPHRLHTHRMRSSWSLGAGGGRYTLFRPHE